MKINDIIYMKYIPDFSESGTGRSIAALLLAVLFQFHCIGWHSFSPADISSFKRKNLSKDDKVCFLTDYTYKKPVITYIQGGNFRFPLYEPDIKLGTVSSNLFSDNAQALLREKFLDQLRKKGIGTLEYARIWNLSQEIRSLFKNYNTDKDSYLSQYKEEIRKKTSRFFNRESEEAFKRSAENMAFSQTILGLKKFIVQNKGIDVYIVDPFDPAEDFLADTCSMTITVNVDVDGDAHSIPFMLNLGLYPASSYHSYIVSVKVSYKGDPSSSTFVYRFYENSFLSLLTLPTLGFLNFGLNSFYRGYGECLFRNCGDGAEIMAEQLLELVGKNKE